MWVFVVVVAVSALCRVKDRAVGQGLSLVPISRVRSATGVHG